MVTIYLALGSNLGDRLANLKSACASLAPGVMLVKTSPIYQTAPWGFTLQPDFLNLVAEATTNLEPEELLAVLKDLEIKLGRQANFRNGPRLIDIDILFYGDRVFRSPRLTIPHPRLAERPFVLIPLGDLAPDLVHPVTGQTILQLQAAAGREGVQLYDQMSH